MSLQVLQSNLTLALQITSVLSTTVTLIIMGCYVTIKRLRRVEFFMIAMICFGDFIESLSIGLGVTFGQQTGDNFNQSYCVAQGFFRAFGILLSFAWTSNIAFTMKLSTMSLSPQRKKFQQRIMYAIGFFGPLILSSIPLMSGQYQLSEQAVSNSLCFFKRGSPSKNWTLFFCIYFPLMQVKFFTKKRITVNFNLYCMAYVINKYKKVTENKKILREVQHLLLYPLILIMCWFITVILRTSQALGYLNQSYLMYVVSINAVNLSGFCNGIAYGMNTIGQIYQSQTDQTISESTIEIEVQQQGSKINCSQYQC